MRWRRNGYPEALERRLGRWFPDRRCKPSEPALGCTVPVVVVVFSRWRDTHAASRPASCHERWRTSASSGVYTCVFVCFFFQLFFFFARFLTWFQNPVLSSTQHFLSFLGPTWRKCWPNLRNVHERSEIRTNGGLGIPRDLSFFVNPWKDPRVRSCTEWGEPPRV